MRPFNPEAFARWRRSVPWSNAEIVAALRQAAADTPRNTGLVANADYLERTGRLTKHMVAEALPRLVKVCGLCGEPALYRYGSVGRCRAHKGDMTPGFQRRRQALDEQSAAFGQHRRDINIGRGTADRLARMRRHGKP